jgi:hypothetical protein
VLFLCNRMADVALTAGACLHVPIGSWDGRDSPDAGHLFSSISACLAFYMLIMTILATKSISSYSDCDVVSTPRC